MRKVIFVLATFMICAIPMKGQSQSTPSIDISTTIEREVTPDELYLKITINENDYKGKKSLEEIQNAMVSALKKSKIDIAENLVLNYMGSEISYSLFSRNRTPKTEATYTLKLHDVTTMQDVISSLEKLQISDIELTKTRYSKEQELKMSMATEAIRQAQAEARILAEAIGQEAGKAISINSWFSGGQNTQPRLYKARSANSADTTVEESIPSLEFGIDKLNYRFNINATFELK